ncbi:MAG: hypothetical protein V4577_16210 [Bacteroidota bacterium]
MKGKITWQTKIVKALAICLLIGLIQWDSWFSLEIRNEILHDLAYGWLAFAALFLLICFALGRLSKMIKGWLLRILFFTFSLSIALFLSGWLFIKILPPGDWKDIYIYQNGDDYLVVQNMVDYRMEDADYWRLVRTSHPEAMIRVIEEQKLYPQGEPFSAGKNEVAFSNKIWRLVPLKK